jgi:glutamate formiminotransferase
VILSIPNWSFGRDDALLRAFRTILGEGRVRVHYCQGDFDHNRTVTAFAGEAEDVRCTLLALCDAAFRVIDLNEHLGVHPRVGALDVCPFVPLGGTSSGAAIAFAETLAGEIASRYDVPVYLYEKSERGRHEADLPTLRRGGFSALLHSELCPDFGPTRVHPTLGATVLGVRDFLIAMNVNLKSTDSRLALRLAREIRKLRSDGDSRFSGVRALGLPLATRDLTQVSLNVTLPDLTPVDPILEWVAEQAALEGVEVAEYELIGVIRDLDVPRAARLTIKAEQVVQWD